MKRRTEHKVTSVFAMLAIVLQVFLPGALAAAGSNGGEVSGLICTSPGHLSGEAKAAIEQLATLLGDETPDRQVFEGHCPLCTLINAAPLAEPVSALARSGLDLGADYACYEHGDLLRRAQGPPLGSRGPPHH